MRHEPAKPANGSLGLIDAGSYARLSHLSNTKYRL